ncbi:MAG: PilZ domain-containing protein [Desulfovibrio sp.]
MAIDISFGDSEERARQAFRTRVPGLEVRFHDSERVFEIKDISASGFAVLDETRGFRNGENYVVSLYLNRKLFLGQAPVSVVRALESGVVGLAFGELKRQQALKLDKLVLEVQKRLIQLRKSRPEG